MTFLNKRDEYLKNSVKPEITAILLPKTAVSSGNVKVIGIGFPSTPPLGEEFKSFQLRIIKYVLRGDILPKIRSLYPILKP